MFQYFLLNTFVNLSSNNNTKYTKTIKSPNLQIETYTSTK